MIYRDSFFYDRSSWIIESRRINAIKEFKPSIINGYYLGKRLVYGLSDNIDIINRYKLQSETEYEFFNNCWIDIQLLTSMVVEEDLIHNSINFNSNNINLINKLYWDYFTEDEVIENPIDPSNRYIAIGDKRPFGNSNCVSDIEDYCKISPDKINIYDKNYQLKIENILYEFIEWVPILVKSFPLEFRSFISEGRIQTVKQASESRAKFNELQLKYLDMRKATSRWTIGISECRDIQIDKIINV